MPDDGAYRAEFRALNDGDKLIAMAHGHVDQAPGQPDTTPPWLEWGEIDGTVITLHFSEPLDENAVGGYFRTNVNVSYGTWSGGRSSNFEISGNKVTVQGNPRAKVVSPSSAWWGADVWYHPPASGSGGLRDLAGNPVTDMYKLLPNVTGPPYVTGVSISSDPGEDGSYARGDAIRVKVMFRKDVDVTGTPRLKIDLDPATGGEKWARYSGGSSARNLEFTYTVAAADLSTAGVAVIENTLEPNGGAIRGAPPGPADDARLAHLDLLHNSAHRVITPDSAAPILKSASVSSTTLTLIFSEPLGAAASLSNGAFTVKKTPQGGTERDVSLSGSPAISGSTVTLTLASAVLGSDAWLKVSYAKPTTGTNNKLVDAGGAEAADFTDEWVTNSLDTTPPRLVRGEIDGDVITLYFSEPLDERSMGGNFKLTLRGNGHGNSFYVKPKEVIISGNKVVVHVTTGPYTGVRARAGQSAWMNYIIHRDPTAAKLRDIAGNAVYTHHGWGSLHRATRHLALDNFTGPPYATGVTISSNAGAELTYASGDTIRVRLTFSEPVNVTGAPRLKIDLDSAEGGEQWADYAGGSGARMLEFSYTVAAEDLSTAGVAVLANTLELNDGAIRSASATTEESANLSHAGLEHDPNHQVDAQR